LSAFAVGNGVGGRRLFIFEDLGLLAGRKRLLLIEFGNGGGVFGLLGWLGFGLFDVETLGGIDDLGVGGGDVGRQRKTGAGSYKIDLDAAVATGANAAPVFAGALEVDAGEEQSGEQEVEEDRVGEVALRLRSSVV